MVVTFLLLEGYSNFVLACLLEPLRMLHEQHQEGIIWRIVTVDDRPVSSSSSLTLLPSARIEDVESSDLLIIISSNNFRQHVTPENQRLVMALVRQSTTIIGADAGAWLLASTGLLDDLPVTLHWSVISEFAETYPQVRVSPDRYVMEGRFWSCGGASTALDLMQAFISDRFGAAKAFAVASMFAHDSGAPQPEVPPSSVFVDPAKTWLHTVMNIMVDTIENPLPLREIADRVDMSERTLNRLFKSELGIPPGQYYQGLRIARARDLAETTIFDLREIALRCGYSDAAALSKAFGRIFGHSIRKKRQQMPAAAFVTGG